MSEELTESPPHSLWLGLATRHRKLSLAARRMLSRGVLHGVPDLSLDLMLRLAHGALLAQGAESWTGVADGHRVHRYAFAGKGSGPAVMLLHGLGGSASSMTPLLPALIPDSKRVVLLELPGHGRSPRPAQALSAREYGQVVIACAEELKRETGGKVVLAGNSLGGALSLYAAHERPDLIAGVVGLNPAGAELSDEAMNALPRSFPDELQGASRMAELLFHKTPWPFWLVARDFARNWGTDTVQRILDDARSGADRSLGIDTLTDLRVPVLIIWGAQDRLLPLRSVEDFRRIQGGRVELLPACGHVPQVERPAVTRKLTAAFLRGLPRE
ncbi:MAG TPA: alpha/beta fold hydrolase [Myxococcales bacterium]|nr:alpha/beta fold hydrolase [Myxococcales bacterium]